MEETQANVAQPDGAKRRRKIANHPELARKLQQYYQIECTPPTSQRLQLWLDQFLRKANVSPELDHRAQSQGDH